MKANVCDRCDTYYLDNGDRDVTKDHLLLQKIIGSNMFSHLTEPVDLCYSCRQQLYDWFYEYEDK